MTPAPDWIAIDQGPAHLRAWAMGGDGVLARATADAGPLEDQAFEPALLALIGDWLSPGRTLPAVACGRIGGLAARTDPPLRPVPCPPLDPSRLTALPLSDPRLTLHVVPGLQQATPADLMQGDETRIAGFLALSPDFDGVVCLPGTHTRWVRLSAAEVVGFQTFLTGELFGLLAATPTLRDCVTADGWDDAAFATALDDALSRPDRLAARLFTLHAESRIAGLSPQAARARLSGALIGAELAAAKPWWLGQSVAILGAPPLSDLYATALATQGLSAQVGPEERMTLAGLGLAHLRAGAA